MLLRVYARCVAGMEDVWIARMDATLRLGGNGRQPLSEWHKQLDPWRRRELAERGGEEPDLALRVGGAIFPDAV